MLIEIKGTDFWNKGAELMLRSIVAELSTWRPQPDAAVATNIGPYTERARLGLYQKITPSRLINAGLPDLTALLPPRLRARYGLVTEREIDAVLDASGFAYSSQWGARSTLRLAAATRRWRRSGKKAVLLPQAFGPFNAPGMRDAFRAVVDRVNLVYARDRQSYKNIMELGVAADKVRQAPDFTITMKGRIPEHVQLGERPAAVVPNARIVDRGLIDQATYIRLLEKCLEVLRETGFCPFVLVHDDHSDLPIAKDLVSRLSAPLSVVHLIDPLELKGVIGACELVVSSRYHALVAALSQNVQAVAIGWSHKYAALLSEYGCPDHALGVQTPPEEVKAVLVSMADPSTRRQLMERLKATNCRYRAATDAMWLEVRSVLTSS